MRQPHALLLALLACISSAAAEDFKPGQELLYNPYFEDGDEGWQLQCAELAREEGPDG